MDEILEKELHAKDNWRAHIFNYIEKRRKTKGLTIEQYCRSQKVNREAFEIWLQFIKREDQYTFFVSFATEYLNRAKHSLSLIQKHLNESDLCMPLMRDAIVAYAAPFRNSNGRTPVNFSLKEIERLIPDSLRTVHEKICGDRDRIVAHCDLGPRNPRVGLFGILLRGAGYYWSDYQKLIPDFQNLIGIVQTELQKHNVRENMTSIKIAFKDFENHPSYVLDDPGLPSKGMSFE